jgi:serine/threonine protein phosphatase PrpC
MSHEHWGDSIIGSPDDEYGDERVLGLASDGYCVVGASVRGRMHIRNEVPREDAFAVYRRHHWLAVAVSDGVGSSKYSRLGASFAVNKVCENLLDQIGEVSSPRKGIRHWLSREAEPGQEQLEKAMLEGLRNTAGDLRKHADSLTEAMESQEHIESSQAVASTEVDTSEASGAGGEVEETVEQGESVEQQENVPSAGRRVALDDLHCTLLALALNLKTGTIALTQIGDGLILGLTEDLNAVPLVEPQVPGQTGQTYVITQKDWERYCSVRVIIGEQSNGLMTTYLMTDGVADDCQYGPPEDILQRWAKDMDSEIRKYDVETTKERLRRYLSEYRAKGSYDDRTLVAVYRRWHERPGFGA